MGNAEINRDLDLSTVEQDLIENGLDSLTHAVDHYLDDAHAHYLKYSVLHTYHAVELMLKARLARCNPRLIFVNPHQPITERSNTLNFKSLRKALGDNGVTVSDQDREDLLSLQRFRNRMEHLRIVHDTEELDHRLGQAMRFLDQFLKGELQLDLEDYLEVRTYDTLITLLHGFDEAVARASQKLDEQVRPDWDGIADVEAIECAVCWNVMVPYPDPNNNSGIAQCRMPECREVLFVTSCDICGTGISSRSEFERGELNFCESCVEYHLN